MTKRLLFVVNVDWFFLSHRLPLALAAVAQGFDVHIAAGVTDKVEELQGYGFTLHSIDLDRRSSGACNAVVTFWQIWQVYKKVRPDIVHLVTIKPVILGGIAARFAGISAVVFAVSGLGFVFLAQGKKAEIRRLVVGLLYRFAFGQDNIIVVFQNPDDKASLMSLAHLPLVKVRIIRGSGVDLRQYSKKPLPNSVPIVLLAARLLADKGVREFVQAARLLQYSMPAGERCVRFVLVGSIDPDNPASLTESELMNWADEGVVELWGQRSDMPQVLESSYLVVLPSYREGLPKVLIEAAAIGRAVITTDVPGCRDAIEDGITGILVPVKNPEALAHAIKQLLDDPVRCKLMGMAARALAERAFDVKSVVAEHIKIYDELMTKIQ